MICGMRSATTNKLYRFSARRWIERSLLSGEFRLVSASYIRGIEEDYERQDDEQTREYEISANRLTVTHERTGKVIPIRSNLEVSGSVDTDYYMLCFTTQNKDFMYELFDGADACLVVRDRRIFTERLFAEVGKVLPGWGAVNASVVYGQMRHEYGAPFMKPEKYMFQFEWRYVWLPAQPIQKLENIVVKIDSIEDIAHIETPR